LSWVPVQLATEPAPADDDGATSEGVGDGSDDAATSVGVGAADELDVAGVEGETDGETVDGVAVGVTDPAGDDGPSPMQPTTSRAAISSDRHKVMQRAGRTPGGRPHRGRGTAGG
jgi:hypothetical protein